MVALTDEEASQLGLPPTQRFPWDSSKGVYLLTAYHNLHCIKLLRTALDEYHRGAARQTWGWAHVLHCLRVLRDDARCNADDTPRYVGRGQPARRTGAGQPRRCRDWRRLEAWSLERHACWRHVRPADHSFREIDRYRFCPDDSPYKAASETWWLEEVDAEVKVEDEEEHGAVQGS